MADQQVGLDRPLDEIDLYERKVAERRGEKPSTAPASQPPRPMPWITLANSFTATIIADPAHLGHCTRFPPAWRVLVSLFVDTGQVWSREPDLSERKIEVAVGPGLWIDTPIGPIRGDIGYRLTDWETSQPRYVFHFSIGPAF